MSFARIFLSAYVQARPAIFPKLRKTARRPIRPRHPAFHSSSVPPPFLLHSCDFPPATSGPETVTGRTGRCKVSPDQRRNYVRGSSSWDRRVSSFSFHVFSLFAPFFRLSFSSRFPLSFTPGTSPGITAFLLFVFILSSSSSLSSPFFSSFFSLSFLFHSRRFSTRNVIPEHSNLRSLRIDFHDSMESPRIFPIAFFLRSYPQRN